MVSSRVGVFSLALAACGIWHPPYTDGGVGAGDAGGDASSEAAASAWLMTCEQYYGQAGLGSSACTTCTHQSCGMQETSAIAMCSSDSDTQCIDTCGSQPPYPPDYCTCLAACLSATCMDARTPDETCLLAACGTMCK